MKAKTAEVIIAVSIKCGIIPIDRLKVLCQNPKVIKTEGAEPNTNNMENSLVDIITKEKQEKAIIIIYWKMSQTDWKSKLIRKEISNLMECKFLLLKYQQNGLLLSF